ncbi:MAG: hypothetical protein ABH951_01215, partial [Patescibacteria group bacterium]
MKKNFLEQKYPDMPGSKPVVRAVEKAKKDPERKFAPHSRDERIQAYLDRVDKIVEDERGWELLKNKIVKDLAIKTDDQDTLAKIATLLYTFEKNKAISEGRKNEVIQLEDNPELIKGYENLAKEKREIQVKSLNSWLDYLKQNDAQYPTWFRYFVVRNLSKMGVLDKEKGEYGERKKLTIAPFPEINSEALGFVYRMLTTGIGSQEFTEENQKEKRVNLQKMIAKKDFVKLYTFAQIETAGTLNRESLKGEWEKYDQGSDYHILENALRGKGTGWCTAEGSAPSHIQNGDFYVYYTKGQAGNYSEPRIAIRMQGDEIAEVRGVNHRQELEPALIDTAQEKYHSLPGGEKFDKKSSDMKKVTRIEKEIQNGIFDTKEDKEELRNDLKFLYEMNSSIEGFGYEKDPRIKELRDQRIAEQDMPIVFECALEQIAHNPNEINENTKAYVGKLFEGIFQKDFEHLYTSFPEGKIQKYEVEIGGKTKDELKKEIKEKFTLGSYAESMMDNPDFIVLKNKEKINTVRLKVSDLGFYSGNPTTDEIYKKAEELGLELCPAETGPHLRLELTDQPLGDYFRVAM